MLEVFMAIVLSINIGFMTYIAFDVKHEQKQEERRILYENKTTETKRTIPTNRDRVESGSKK